MKERYEVGQRVVLDKEFKPKINPGRQVEPLRMIGSGPFKIHAVEDVPKSYEKDVAHSQWIQISKINSQNKVEIYGNRGGWAAIEEFSPIGKQFPTIISGAYFEKID